MALRNFTRILCMFLDSFGLLIENKKNYLGRTVLEMWSQVCGKIAMLVQVKKSIKKHIKFKNLKVHFFSTFSMQFFLNYFLVFY